MHNIDAVHPIASLVRSQVHGIQIERSGSPLCGQGFQFGIIVINGEIRDFNAGRAIIMSAEDNTCASTRRHVVGVRHEIRQYQDCAVHACAVDLPVFIDRESARCGVRKIDYKVIPSFSPESSSADAYHQVVLVGL